MRVGPSWHKYLSKFLLPNRITSVTRFQPMGLGEAQFGGGIQYHLNHSQLCFCGIKCIHMLLQWNLYSYTCSKCIFMNYAKNCLGHRCMEMCFTDWDWMCINSTCYDSFFPCLYPWKTVAEDGKLPRNEQPAAAHRVINPLPGEPGVWKRFAFLLGKVWLDFAIWAPTPLENVSDFGLRSYIINASFNAAVTGCLLLDCVGIRGINLEVMSK